MSNETTTLAIPPAITKKVQPKPTKAELIEALAIRQRQALMDANTELEVQIAKLSTEFDSDVRTWIQDNIAEQVKFGSIFRGYVYGGPKFYVGNASFTLRLDNLPAETVRKRLKIDTLQIQRQHIPSLHEAKKKIREKMGHLAPRPTENRVAAMVNDPGMARALDKMLAELAKPAQPTQPQIAAA